MNLLTNKTKKNLATNCNNSWIQQQRYVIGKSYYDVDGQQVHTAQKINKVPSQYLKEYYRWNFHTISQCTVSHDMTRICIMLHATKNSLPRENDEVQSLNSISGMIKLVKARNSDNMTDLYSSGHEPSWINTSKSCTLHMWNGTLATLHWTRSMANLNNHDRILNSTTMHLHKNNSHCIHSLSPHSH